MSEHQDLQRLMVEARELYAWFLALQEAGFPEAMAYGLLAPLMMTGVIGRD
jgi:hypothetical protein